MLLSGVKAVVFDLDGTLYDLKRLRLAMTIALVRELGLRPHRLLKVIRILRHYRRALEELRSREQPCENLPDAQLALAALRCGESAGAVRECVQGWFVERPQAILKGLADAQLAEILDSMRQANLKLAVLSDYPAVSKLEALGIDRYFHVILSADQVGNLKPNPAGLLLVLRQLNVQPEEALNVGDRYEIDAVTAQQAGVRCAIIGRGGAHRDGCVNLASIAQLRQLLPNLQTAR